jgi:hypothetical protein
MSQRWLIFQELWGWKVDFWPSIPLLAVKNEVLVGISGR